jgi:hypothetical protein
MYSVLRLTAIFTASFMKGKESPSIMSRMVSPPFHHFCHRFRHSFHHGLRRAFDFSYHTFLRIPQFDADSNSNAAGRTEINFSKPVESLRSL